jgi:hypothetical protein
MSNSAAVQIALGQRLTIVEKVGTPGIDSDGQSLQGLNVHAYPDGVLVWVRESDRFYQLRKNLDPAIVRDDGTFRNVVDSIGSSAVNGRWVAVIKMGTVVLEGEEGGSTGEIDGFALVPDGFFHATHQTLSGTPGVISAQSIDQVTVRVTSTENGDLSTVFVSFYPFPI